MMDMFTIILVFLLNFFDPETSTSSALELPTSRATNPVEQGVRLRVARDGIQVGSTQVVALVAGRLPEGIEVSNHEIVPVVSALSAALPAGGEPPPLVVEADRLTPYALFGDVLVSARAAGWSRYRFVVLDEAG